MAKASVRICDQCEGWDEDSNPVVRATIIGPRFDLCRNCRADHLGAVGLAEEDIAMYLTGQEEGWARKGPSPRLTDVLDGSAEQNGGKAKAKAKGKDKAKA